MDTLTAAVPKPTWLTEAKRAIIAQWLTLVPIGIQALLVPQMPLKFAPALAASLAATWYLDRFAGLTAVIAAAVAVNWLLLPPEGALVITVENLVASGCFVVLGGICVQATHVVRCRLELLEAQAAATAAELERLRTREASADRTASEFHARLTAAHTAATVAETSFTKLQRYVSELDERYRQAEACITELPVPTVVVEILGDHAVIRWHSREFASLCEFDSANPPALLDDACELTTPNGSPLPALAHPLSRAVGGNVVAAQTLGLKSGGSLFTVLVWARWLPEWGHVTLTIVPVSRVVPPHEWN